MQSIRLGNYIINRLKEVGVDTIFGVPGDYTLPLMDLIEDDKDITWGNNANELNAAYAADGYARIKGASAIFTAMGEGELSAVNGIAGAYAEMLPVIHVVGTPTTKVMEQKAIMHHTLGNGDYDVFFNMASMVTIASTKLTLGNATQEVDRVIQAAYVNKRPGYISIPMDLMYAQVEIPVNLAPLNLSPRKNPAAVQKAALYHTINAIQSAKNPIVIVDVPTIRFNLMDEANAFLTKSGFPAFVTPMGKGAVDIDLPNYRGVYNGSMSLPQVLNEYEEADLVIEIGSIPADTNLGGFSSKQTRNNTITLNFNQITAFHTEYENVGFVEFLPLLTDGIEKKITSFPPRITKVESVVEENTQVITHNYFWNTISKYLSRDSIIVTEHGTSLSGAQNLHGSGKSSYLNQYLWGSIGYSVGATLGAAMAARDRTVYLFVGDGSFQMSAQEISVFLRQGITPVIILINNNGYLVEKLIRGPQRSYNNFQMWRYNKTYDYFGGHSKTNSIGWDKHPSAIGVEAKVDTRESFEKVMTRVKGEPNKIHFIEVIFPPFDSPSELSFICSVVKGKMDLVVPSE